MSSFHGGRSGNRGGCAQPCRLAYEIDGKMGCYLNLKDRWGLESLEELAEAGVDSLKIEGRMKGVPYVAGVTRFYRELLDQIREYGKIESVSREEIDKVRQLFNRGDFTDGYFHQKQKMIESGSPKNQGLAIGEVFSADNGRVRIRAQKTLHAGDELEIVTGERGQAASIRLQEAMIAGNGKEASFKLHGKIRKGQVVRRIVDPVLGEQLKQEAGTLPKIPVDVTFAAHAGEASELTVSAQTKDGRAVTATVKGAVPEKAQKAPLTETDAEKRLGKMGDSVFEMRGAHMDIDNDLFLPVSALNEIRREALGALEAKLTEKEPLDGAVLLGRENLLEAARILPAEQEKKARGFEWLLSDSAQWEALKNEKAERLERIVLALEGFTESDKTALVREIREWAPAVRIVIRLPLAGRMIREERIRKEWEDWQRAGVKAGEASRLGQIELLREWGAEVLAGPDLGVMNQTAAAFFAHETEGYFLSRELSMKEIRALREDEKAALTIFGRVPYMVTEQCVFKERYGCQKTPKGHVTVMKDRTGEKMRAVSHCLFCYSEIYSGEPVAAPEAALGFAGIKRIEWTLEEGENCRLIWRSILEGRMPEGYRMRGHFEKEVE